MYAALTPGEQMRVDRTLGRRVVDIKRLASLLPKVASVSSDSTPGALFGFSSAKLIAQCGLSLILASAGRVCSAVLVAILRLNIRISMAAALAAHC